MIEYIKGTVTELTPTSAIIETAGVGYFLHISLITYSLLDHQKDALLYTYEAIREDAHLLFGFYTKEEREMFLLLISVSGIGANTARMMLSSLSVDEMKQIILSEDSTALKNIKGIGLKTAQRVIIDLKDKVKLVSVNSKAATIIGNTTVKSEAASALVMLGFQQLQVTKALDKIFTETPSIPIEQAIKKALKIL
jgi:Holliday junction DNA helicase RuvA